jgi:hypothetical protein
MKRLIIGGIAALAIGLTSCTSPATHEEGTAHTTATRETSTAQATTTQETSTAHTTTVTESPSPTKDPSDLDPATYQSISARDFAILVKDPDSARGRKIVIYGSVTQSDAATGNKAFRATVMGQPHADHTYQINSVIVANDPSIPPPPQRIRSARGGNGEVRSRSQDAFRG